MSNTDVAPSGAFGSLPVKPPFDPSQPFVEKPPFDPSKPFAVAAPTTSVPESVEAGIESGATAGWNPELAGLTHASGIPDRLNVGALSPLTLPVGAARLAYEHFTGQRGTATEAYEKARDALLQKQATMQKEHPIAYGGGELAGSLVPMALGPEASGPGFIPRVVQGAKLGAGYGAASEAHTGFEKTGVGGAVEGAGLGAVEGALGGAGGEVAGTALGKVGTLAVDKFGAPITSAVRGWLAPEAEAARRVAGALTQDYPQVSAGTSLGMTPTEWAAAKAAGEPVTIADLGGETTRALMRSAANTSPEGRAALQSVIADRFAQQNDRAGVTVRSLVQGGANTAKTKAQLEAEYDAERGDAYKAAYDAGDKPIWSPELERLTSAPTVVGALRGAVDRWKDWQVKDGFGGMNPPVKVTPDGQLQFTGGKGMLPYPNLQLWDYAARNLAGMASAARRAGNNTEASLYGGLEQRLKGELDKQVPEFADARGVAAKFFGGNNAIEAAQEAVRAPPRPGSVGDPAAIQRAMAGMKPAERGMFQESYADSLAAKLEATGDNRDITNSLFNSPQERKKIGAVFGPHGIDKIQAFVNREKIYDAARKALGNSTTVRQMMEAGLAGGAVGAYLGNGDPRSIAEGAVSAAGLGAGGAASGLMRQGIISGTKTALGYVDRNTATRVAKLLASDNPVELARGLQMAARNQRVGAALGDVAAKVSAAAGALRRPKAPIMQLPRTTSANDQQQNVPRPPSQ